MPQQIAMCYIHMMSLYSDQGEYPEAKRLLLQARALFKQSQMPQSVAICDVNLAIIHLAQGGYTEAESLLKSNIEGIPGRFRWVILWMLARLYNAPDFQQRDEEVAYHYYSEAIEFIESMRGKQDTDTDKILILYDKMQVYAEMVQLCVKMKNHFRAYEYVERAKSRALLDLMEQAAMGQKAEDELAKQDFELASLVSVRVKSPEEIQAILPKGTVLLEYFYEGDIAYMYGIMKDKPIVVKEFNINLVRPFLEVMEKSYEFETAEELLTSVDSDEKAILHNMFHRGASIEKGELYIRDWLCYTIFDLYEKHDEPTGEIKQVKRDSQIKDAAYEHLAILYRELIRPMQDVVDSAERLIIVPHDVLHHVPFSALIDVSEGREQDAKKLIHTGEAKYLIETKTVLMIPSGSMVVVCKEKQRPKPEDVLAVRQPALGKDDRPIEYGCELERYFGEEKTNILLGRDATIPNFVEALHTHLPSVIHFDTHGMFNANNGLYSWLAMSKLTEYGTETEQLYVVYILNLNLQACLVVLRACMSGLGEVHPGDDIIGLTRAFFYAGVPSIVASMWEIDDQGSCDLIESFYDAWLKCGDKADKAEALRKAQLEMMKFLDDLGKERHPYRWAGFALYGDWE